MPPRCVAGLCRCFSVRFSTAAQVGPAHCLCAADLTFAFAVLSCARLLLFCPHLCRCCSLPSMAFLCRRASVLVFAAAVLSDSLPPPFASRHGFSLPSPLVSEHCHAMPPPCKSCPCRRVSLQCSSLLFRRCSWRSNSLPSLFVAFQFSAGAYQSDAHHGLCCAFLRSADIAAASPR